MFFCEYFDDIWFNIRKTLIEFTAICIFANFSVEIVLMIFVILSKRNRKIEKRNVWRNSCKSKRLKYIFKYCVYVIVF